MAYLDNAGVTYLWSKIKAALSGKLGKTETAAKTSGILSGTVDGTSTSTAYTATVDGIDSLTDGVCVLLKNGVVTSAAGFTININGLGAKPVYTNLAAATAETTKFNVNYTMLFVYDSTRVSGGCWICYNGYDSNTNTIGYQLRTNSALRPAADTGYRYRLWFTSLDGKSWVPSTTSTSTNATSSRTPNTRTIDPFGEIIYYSPNATVTAGNNLGATTSWIQYTMTFGYAFNNKGAALTLTNPAPIYIKCTPQAGGGVKMNDYVQTLPSTADGYVYLFIGMAYSATAVELFPNHPVYYHNGTGICLWTGQTIPTRTSDLTNDSGFITDAGVTSFNGSTGAITYAAPVTSVNGSTGAVTVAVPSKTSDLTNDSGFITDAGVTSFNGSTGAVTYSAPVASVNGQTGAVTVSVPTKTSDLTNDSGFITDAGVTSFNGSTGAVTYTAPVTSVNGNTGAVTVQPNVQADWNETDSSSQSYIQNKPTIPPGATVDSALSTTSENAVQNKVITSALNDKAETTALTDGSVTKVGTGNVGNATKPIYLASGTPTAGSQYVPTTGGTYSDDIRVYDSTENSRVIIGGAASGVHGVLRMYDNASNYGALITSSALGNNNSIWTLPVGSGTLAKTSDITAAVDGIQTVAGNAVSAIGAMNATSGTATLTSTAAAANASWFPLGTITFTTVGRYMLDVLIDFNDASVSSTGLRALRLKRNGSSTVNPIDMDSRLAHANGNMRNHCRVVALVAATAGYTVDVECWQNNGAVLTTRCYYSWMRVG